LPRHYLDHNATAPLRPAVKAAVVEALDLAGNASSIHSEGRAMRALIEDAREALARALGTLSKNIVFTSGGTEAASLALSSSLTHRGKPFERLLVSAGEHACMISGHDYQDRVDTINLMPDGTLDIAHLSALLAHTKGRSLVAVHAANNETGVIQSLKSIADLVHQHDGALLVDGVQAFGRIDFTFHSTDADLIIISAHKSGGPKGVGALCFAQDVVHISHPPLRGGGQERGLRAGTENVQAIAGLSALLQARDVTREAEHCAQLRMEFEQRLRAIADDVIIFGETAARLPNTSSFAIPGLKAQTMLIALDLMGLSVSSGSACSSGKITPSHVLAAMGFDAEVALCAVRVSLGWSSCYDDIDALLHGIEEQYKILLKKRQKNAA